MKRLVTFCIIVLLLITTACQATPENPIIVDKSLDRMIEDAARTLPPIELQTGQKSTLYSQYAIPETYQVQLSGAGGELLIYGQAAIHVPDVTQMPIARVQASVFSQDTINRIYDALIGDTPMYLPSELLTKAKIELLIDDLYKMMDEDTNEEVRTQIEDILKRYQEQYKTAPETTKKIMADATLQEDGRVNLTSDVDRGGMHFTVSNDPEFDPSAKVRVWQDEYGNTQVDAPRSNSLILFALDENKYPPFVAYSDGVVLLDATDHSIQDDSANSECTLGITPMQARILVGNFLVKAGIEDMEISRVLLVAQKDWKTGNPVQGGQQAYEVQCQRVMNAVMVDSLYGESRAGDSVYSFNWAYEQLFFSITDEGIEQMEWRAPLHVIEVVNENANIKSFSEIKEIFEKMMLVIYEPRAREFGPYRFEYEITDVKLTLQRIIEQNSYVNGLLIPVWNFYGTTTTIEIDRDRNTIAERMAENQYQKPLLSINAIDGSIIDIDRGY